MLVLEPLFSSAGFLIRLLFFVWLVLLVLLNRKARFRLITDDTNML